MIPTQTDSGYKLEINNNMDISSCQKIYPDGFNCFDLTRTKKDQLLISKAPEMLAMLELMVKEFDVEFTNKYQFDLHQKAKQLIKEAKEL